MAPRRRGAAAPQGDQRSSIAVQIGALPPELLVAAFGFVPLLERHSSLSLVCREWAELVHSSPLLGSLDIALCSADGGRLLGWLRALAGWLARRAAGHVQQLRLEVALKHGPAVGLAQGQQQQQQQQQQPQQLLNIDAALSISAALRPLAGSLRQLQLAGRGLLLQLLEPSLPHVTSFELSSDQRVLPFSATLAHLAGLRSMRLDATCGLVYVVPGTRLPPYLTRLWIRSDSSALPAGLGTLSHLQELTLVGCQPPIDGYAALANLHASLTSLNLTGLYRVPDCLAQLTGLRSLTIADSEADLGEADTEILEQALPELQHLTAVYLFSAALPQTPAALSSLRRLHTVCWCNFASEPRPLPGGAWLSGLRRLALSCHFLSDAASLKTLDAARHLQRLGLDDVAEVEDLWREQRQEQSTAGEAARQQASPVQRFFDWAQRHGSLQLLALDASAVVVAAAAVAAQGARPGLSVEVAGPVHEMAELTCGHVCQLTG